MKLSEILTIIDGRLFCGDDSREITTCCASDLMSDVLTLEPEDALLITGLCTNQALHTAEMADIESIVFIRGKQPDARLLKLAEENDLALASSPMSMFRACGLLYANGLRGPYQQRNNE